MSDTPRTDTTAQPFGRHDPGIVDADFARQLERELATMRERADGINDELKSMTTRCETALRERDAMRERAEKAEAELAKARGLAEREQMEARVMALLCEDERSRHDAARQALRECMEFYRPCGVPLDLENYAKWERARDDKPAEKEKDCLTCRFDGRDECAEPCASCLDSRGKMIGYEPAAPESKPEPEPEGVCVWERGYSPEGGYLTSCGKWFACSCVGKCPECGRKVVV